ncbi:MAG: DnaK suppressor protein [Verrucomicrobiota bacterium]|jgi:RNA polymerase-binding transcription factor DksA
MASSPKKKASKKPAKPKAQKKTAARSKASPARAKTAQPAKKAARAAKKPAAKKSSVSAKKTVGKKAPVRAEKISKANGARKNFNASGGTTPILAAKNHKERRLDPFTRGQKEKLLQLRDAMVDSMAGVAKDNLRSRAEGSEASAFGMHQADAGSDAYDRDFALSLLSQEQDALYEIDQALKRIELGTYGTCEMSGKAISHARLEAIPFARFTVECQSQLEKQNKASRVRQSVTSLFGLTDEEGAEGEEEEAKADDSKD